MWKKRKYDPYAIRRKPTKYKYKINNFRKLYGLNEDRYYELLISNGNHCAICKELDNLFIDHDHNTGKVRGLLCRRCNIMLGNAKDSIRTLCRAIEYLTRNNSGQSQAGGSNDPG